MINKLVPASRLTIIFILAVVLSGSILTYFSINNISNLKQLTEKRILEEQRELSARFSSAIQTKLDDLTSGLDKESGVSDILKDALIKRTSVYDFIVQPFILQNDGQFLYPNFAGIPEDIPEETSSGGFHTAFMKGEEAEFADKDPGKAKSYYMSCLRLAIGNNDSAKALNALGRVSVKLDNIENATNFYSLIVSGFYNTIDQNGLPYAYYALPQLLRIKNTDSPGRILEPVEFCLGKMENGAIPLNYATEELLNLVGESLKKYPESNIEKTAGITNLATSLKKQVQFVIANKKELPELLKNENSDNRMISLNGFKVVNRASGNVQEFFFINTDSENRIGFAIDRFRLFNFVLKQDLQADLEFNYRIDFPEMYRSEKPGDNLIYTTQMTPWFPDQQIEISLVNKNIIKDLVSRRGLIYGIASLLLLVAMCLGVVLILRDIARERNLARLRADFISNVTHELKTPLTSIRMYTESLLMGRVKAAETQKEYLEVVVNESERLKRMINNILEYSKMEKGKPEYHFICSNLASIVKSAIHEMNYWFEKEEFVVVTELDENINAEIDPDKMKQVIENMLSNAIKYSTDTKKIFTRLYMKNEQICIEVEDKGIGIPQDKLSRIFEPFYRIEQKDSISGTGLGLTVVKEIVEAHHGNISVSSEVGKESRFTVRLPVAGN